MDQPITLRRKLRWWQIYFITITGIIGIGFFTGSGTILAIAGPGGTILAFAIVGIVACLVMEGICEMTVLWPIPNPMFEFVRTFVDEDLATVVGIAYWLTYTLDISAILVSTAKLADYWGIPAGLKTVIYAVTPIVLAALNLCKVEVFGVIEGAGGILKLTLVLFVFVLMIAVNRGAGPGEVIGSKNWGSFLDYNPDVANNNAEAILIAIPQAIFAYIGVELLTTTAFEATDSSQLKTPAKHIAWQITAIYIAVTTIFVFNVAWDDPNLPLFFGQGQSTSTCDPTADTRCGYDPPLPIIPLLHSDKTPIYPTLAGVLTAILIYSGLSAYNTGLYVASRSFFGLVRTLEVDDGDNPGRFRRMLARLPNVSTHGAPVWGVIFSAFFIYWLPFIHFADDSSQDYLQTVLINIGSVSAIIVWCSQCVAYIFYDEWRRKHRVRITKHISESRTRLVRSGDHSILSVAQPVPAYLGAIATSTILLVFNTVALWNGKKPVLKAMSYFLSPLLIGVLWVVIKYARPRVKGRRRWFVDLSKWEDFDSAVARLDGMVHPKDRHPERNVRNGLLGGPHVSPSSTGSQHRAADPGDMVDIEYEGNVQMQNIVPVK